MNPANSSTVMSPESSFRSYGDHWLRPGKQADDLRSDLFSSEFVQVSCVGSEVVRFDSKVLQHGHEQIAEWLVALAAEREVLAVAESAAGQQDGKIGGVVNVRVPEIAAVENHGVVQKSLAILGLSREVIDELSQLDEVFPVCGLKLAQFLLVLAVMAEVVVGGGCLFLIGQA